LNGECGGVEAELKSGEHGEEDPEREGAFAEAGDDEQEKADAADDYQGFVRREWNQEQAARGEEGESGGEKDFE